MASLRFKAASTASNLVIGLTLIPALIPLCFAFSVFDEHGTTTWWQALLALGCFIAPLAVAAKFAARLMREIEVTEEKIREIRRSGKITEIRWDEEHALKTHAVRVTKLGLPLSTTTTLTVTTPDRRQIRFAVVEGPRAGAIDQAANGAVPLVLSRSTGETYPRLRKRLAAGQTVPFGDVALSSDRIEVRGKAYPRQSLKKVSTQNGELRLDLEGKIFDVKVPVKDIANYRVLVRLVDEP
jgi:hypothetical protein